MVKFFCHVCGQKIQVPSAHMGRRVKCTGCGQVLVVPGGKEPVGAAAGAGGAGQHAARRGHRARSGHSHSSHAQRSAPQPEAGQPAAGLAEAVAQVQAHDDHAGAAPGHSYRRGRRKKDNTTVVVAIVLFLFLGFVGLGVFLAVKYGGDSGPVATGDSGGDSGAGAASTGGPRKMPTITPRKSSSPPPSGTPSSPPPAPAPEPVGGGVITIAGIPYKMSPDGGEAKPVNPAPPTGSGITTFYDVGQQQSVVRTPRARLAVNKGEGTRALQLFGLYRGAELASATRVDVRLAIVVAGADWQSLPGGADLELTVVIDGKELPLDYETKEPAGDLAGQTADRITYIVEPTSWLNDIATASTVRLRVLEDEYDVSAGQRKMIHQFHSYIRLGQ